MKKNIKSTELRREEISSSGQFYSSKTITKQYDINSELFKETYKFEQAQNNGHSNIEEAKELKKGKLIRVVKSDFNKTYQIEHCYFDNIQIKENRLIWDGNSHSQGKLKDLISVEKRFLDGIGRVNKISLEDYKNPENNFITEIKYKVTTSEFESNGLLTSEITKRGNRVVSRRNIHENGKKCDTITNFNSEGIVSDIENKIVFSDNNDDIIVTQTYIRLEDNSFQVKRLNIEIVHKELNSYLHKVSLIFEFNELQKGKTIDRIEDINLFQVLDSKAEIWSKVESIFNVTDNCLFQYFRIINGRPLEEVDTQFNFNDVFETVSDIFPATLIFENIINGFMDEGNYINYIHIPFSPKNQDYYLRVWNNQKCGYYKVEYL